MRSLFPLVSRRPHEQIAGLELGPNEVRLVALSRDRQHSLQLERYACERLPAGTIGDDGIDELESLIESVHQLWDRNHVHARQVAIGIPARLTTTTLQPVEADTDITDEAQLQALARKQAAQGAGFPIDEAALDFSLLKPTSSTAPARLFTAVVHSDLVHDLQAMCEALGLSAITIDINIYAAYHAWRTCQLRASAGTSAIVPISANGDDLVCLLHLDFTDMHCTLFDRGIMIGSQSRPVTASTSSTRQLARLADKLLQDVLAKGGGVNDHLVISGESPHLAKLCTALNHWARHGTVVAAPLSGLRRAHDINHTQLVATAPAYLTACGLALRGFDAGKK